MNLQSDPLEGHRRSRSLLTMVRTLLFCNKAFLQLIVSLLQPVPLWLLSAATAAVLASFPDIQTIGLDEKALINRPWKDPQK